MTFPVDETGRLLPATLCLEVTSQDFDVGFATYPESPCGHQHAEIELLPEFDSRTVIFTLIPRGDSPYVGTSRVMVRVFYRGQPIAELRLATTIVPRVAELQYVLDASPLLVGTRPGGLGAAANADDAPAPSKNVRYAQQRRPRPYGPLPGMPLPPPPPRMPRPQSVGAPGPQPPSMPTGAPPPIQAAPPPIGAPPGDAAQVRRKEAATGGGRAGRGLTLAVAIAVFLIVLIAVLIAVLH
jgi:hypothetical protein